MGDLDTQTIHTSLGQSQRLNETSVQLSMKEALRGKTAAALSPALLVVGVKLGDSNNLLEFLFYFSHLFLEIPETDICAL